MLSYTAQHSSAGIFQQVSTGTETPTPKGMCLGVCFRVGVVRNFRQKKAPVKGLSRLVED